MGRFRILTCTWFVLTLVAAGVIAGSDARAAFPGSNGKIAVTTSKDGNAEIYSMNPDGTGLKDLSNNPANDLIGAFSADGRRIAFVSERDGNREIYVMNANGTAQNNLTNNPAKEGDPTWSPDGTKIAFTSERDGNKEIYVMNSDGSSQTRLTNDPAIDDVPSWSPDGTRIAFTTNRDSNFEIYTMNTDGTGATNLTKNAANDLASTWAPDASHLGFSSNRDGNYEVYEMKADGTAQTRLTNDPGTDIDPGWSPDGKQMIFDSDRSGRFEIWLMDLPTTSAKAKAAEQTQLKLTIFGADGGGEAFGPRPQPREARLEVTKTDTGPKQVGEEIEFVITIQNINTLVTAKNVNISDFFDVGDATPTHITSTAPKCSDWKVHGPALNVRWWESRCELGDLDPQEKVVIRYSVSVLRSPGFRNLVVTTSKNAPQVVQHDDVYVSGKKECETVGSGPPATGNDVIRGTAKKNVICGLHGNDKIFGKGGDDVIYAGSGNDVVYGGPGDDQLYGQSGKDTLVGGPGHDRCSPDPGTPLRPCDR